jgi:hypothetical protein
VPEFKPEGKATKWSLLTAYNPDSSELSKIEELHMEDTTKGLLVANYVWDYNSLEWVKATQTTLSTDILYLALDEVEALLTTIDADTSAMVTDLAAIEVLLGTIDADTSALFGCVAGNELQVDVVTFPSEGIVTTPGTGFISEVVAGASTTTPLNANSSFTSSDIDMLNWTGIGVNVITDQASATTGFQIQFSSDGTNWDLSHGHTLEADESHFLMLPPEGRYARVKLTNGGTNQTYLRLQTIVYARPPVLKSEVIDGDIHNDTIATLVRSVITGETTAGGGGYVNVKVNPSGALVVEPSQADTVWAVQDSTNEALLTSILADTASMDTSLISAVTLLGTIDADTGAIKTAVEAIQTAVQIMDDWDLNDRCRVSPISGQDGVAANAGAVGATTQRVTLASDDPAVVALQIMDDWDESDRAKVNLIAGQAGIAAGAGAVGATVPRVTLASDDPLLVETQDNKQDYFLGGWLVDGTDVYVGKEDKAGNYMIIKHATDTGVVTYEGGSGGLPVSSGWAALSYQAYSTEF